MISAIWILVSQSILYSVDEAKLAHGFSIDLFHRHSPVSPLYNPKMPGSEVITNAALRSISRANHILQLINIEDADEVESVIIPDRGDYLARIYIGTPPTEALVVADTGSDLIWVQCLPCELCYPQDTPVLFDPSKSSTFTKLSCDSKACKALVRYSCGFSNECRYFYSYEDNSFTSGDLANDTISFGSTEGDPSNSFPNSVFGCGHSNGGKFTSSGTGLVGLGGGALSLVSQIGTQISNKFSYCLLPMSVNSTSKLRFGEEATVSGLNSVMSTPLVSKHPSTYYYVTLEGVTIGQDTVETGQSGNIIVDSGTTITLLESSLYDKVEDILVKAIDYEQVMFDPPEPFKVCYRSEDGYSGVELDFPDTTFHFSGGTDLVLKPINTFVPYYDDLVCLGIVPTKGLSIFGCLAQVNFQVEFDLKGRKISFAPADCTKQ